MSDRKPFPKQEIPGWYIKFQSDILQQLPRPEDGMDKVTALRWDKDQRGLKQNLKSLVTPPKIELSDKRFSIIDTFDMCVLHPLGEVRGMIELSETNNTQQRLFCGQKLKVDFLWVRGKASVMDCVTFLKNDGALLLGSLGSVLIAEEQARLANKSMRIPLSNRWTASLGEHNANEDCSVSGVIGPDYENYEPVSKTKEEVAQEGGIIFLFCFRDAS